MNTEQPTLSTLSLDNVKTYTIDCLGYSEEDLNTYDLPAMLALLTEEQVREAQEYSA